VYDGGDFPGALDKVLDAIGGLSAFRERQRAARAQGRWLGLGVASYVEGTGVGPFESATVRIEPGGSIFITSGACSQGQAWRRSSPGGGRHLGGRSRRRRRGTRRHGADPDGRRHDRQPQHGDAVAAITCASDTLKDKVFAIAGNMLECAPLDLELRQGKVGVKGAPGLEVTLASVAQAARPGWDSKRPAGMGAGLEETHYWEPPTVTWANATHLAVVEVDGATARSRSSTTWWRTIAAWSSTRCWSRARSRAAPCRAGRRPARGFVYDQHGQLLTGSLMDYAMPRATTCRACSCCTRCRPRRSTRSA